MKPPTQGHVLAAAGKREDLLACSACLLTWMLSVVAKPLPLPLPLPMMGLEGGCVMRIPRVSPSVSQVVVVQYPETP